jgi:tetratricopeptide (TPR) repeat protein
MSDPHIPSHLSLAEAQHIDRACDRFEAAWQAGQRPEPEEYLGDASERARSALLRLLLFLDWDYRRRAGETPSTGDYHPRFPGDAVLIEAVGQEMAESPDSTCEGPGGPPAADTPWSGGRAAGHGGELTAGIEAGPGRYDLVQEVGHGGIGVVYRGRDGLLGRELAVKVLQETYADKPEARRRLAEEARITGRLQHPGVVPVHDLGHLPDGRPYFAMKLVRGRTLAALLADRRDPAEDRPRLLAVFEQVCQAVAYAHSEGVVHRDLKPSNVMVGAFGEVQVMDWGFAKVLPGVGATERDVPGPIANGLGPGLAGTTHSGCLMGTPAYMPPEQARGEAARIDRRADVFALGAILCELLTGRPPYAGDADEVCRRAAEGNLNDVYARLDACGADETLRELAKRCLAADRGARPADAGAVAKEMTAYLASAQERLRRAELERAAAEAREQEARAKAKAERRARRLTLALAAAAVAVLGLAGAGWWWYDRVRQAEADQRATVAGQVRDSLSTARSLLAENKPAAAREKLAQARARLGNDRSAPGDLAAELEAGEADLDRFQQFLDLIDRAHQAETAPLVGATLVDGSHGSAGSLTVARTEGRRPAAAVQFLLAALQGYDVLGHDDWNSTLGRGLLGESQVEQIRRLVYEELLWLADDVLTRRQEHRSEAKLSPEATARQALVYLGKAESAHRPTRALYALRARCRKDLGDEAAEQADTQLAAKTPPTLAVDHYLRGRSAYVARRFADGVEAFEAALRVEPTHYWSMIWLAACLSAPGRGPDALAGAARVFTGCILRRPDHAHPYYCRALLNIQMRRYQDAVDDSSRVIDLDPKHAGAWHNRGVAYGYLKQLDKAVDNLSRAIELDPSHAVAWHDRGIAYAYLKQPDSALTDFSRAVELDPKYVAAWYDRGVLYNGLNRPGEALADYSKAIDLDPTFVSAWQNRGVTHSQLRQPEKALTDLSRAIDLNPKHAEAWYNRGRVYSGLREFEKASTDYTQAIDLNPKHAQAWANRGIAHYKLGQPDEAVADLSTAIRLAPNEPWLKETYRIRAQVNVQLAHFAQARDDYQTYLKRVPSHHQSRNDLAWLLATCPDAGLRDPAQAVESAKKAVELAPAAGDYWNTLGVAHYRAGDWKAAVAALDKSRGLRQGGDAVDWLFLAMAHRKLGHRDEALKAYEQAVGWLEKNQEALDKDKDRAGELRRFRAEAEEVLELARE